MDFQVVNVKKMENSRGVGKFDSESRGFNFKKIDILNREGGLHFFSGKAQYKFLKYVL